MKKKECFKAIVWLKPQSGTCNAATATAHQFPVRSELDCLLQQQRNHVIAAAVSGKKKNILKNLPFFFFSSHTNECAFCGATDSCDDFTHTRLWL